jgi:hypothetical protein
VTASAGLAMFIAGAVPAGAVTQFGAQWRLPGRSTRSPCR